MYESAAVVVVNKPGGVLTQAPPGIDSMELRIRQWLSRRSGHTNPWVGCLHRLDRPVSGLLAFGLTRRATQKIAKQFETREVRKNYWAVVDRIPADKSGQWVDTMRKIPDEAKSELVPPDHPDARQAILNYVVAGDSAGLCWLEIDLETGRTHQIRIQCAKNLASILGDELYDSTKMFGPQSADRRERCIALHARNLEFFDPGIQQKVNLVADLPDSWQVFAEIFSALPLRS